MADDWPVGRQNVPRPLAVFRAWVWDPTNPLAPLQWRGSSTATLSVWPKLLVIQPNVVGRLVARIRPLQYDWPAVVVERLSWLPGVAFPDFSGVLFEIDGRLGRAQATGGSRGRLAAALRAAEFQVIEVHRVGWEAPRRVEASTLVDHAHLLPRAIIDPAQ